MIWGYAEQASPFPGGIVTLRVATDAPQFRVELYRCGARMTRFDGSPWLAGRKAPFHLPFQDWGEPGMGLHGEQLEPWPAYELAIPSHCPSGVYVAVLIEGDGAGHDNSQPDRTTPDGRDAKAMFVVRAAPDDAASVLYKIPLLTYHAYNLIDGEVYDPMTQRGHWCLYNSPSAHEVPRPVPPGVGLHRPGGGTGATPYDITNFDPFDPTPRQTFVHWDARFVAWLEREGYRVDFCTDVDLHRDGDALLAPYRLLVSAGHDEYWSDDMRAAVEGRLAAGGNAAFFGGNTCWWRVVFSDEVTFSRVEFWHEAGRPENSLIGVSFRNGGERDRDEHPNAVGYRVQNADHWVYSGTGVSDGDVFGAGPNEYLIGYEADGAHFDRADLEAGRPVRATGEDGTPEGFTILAVGDTRPSGWGFGNCAATMGLYSRRGTGSTGTGSAGTGSAGTVFNGGTTDWARVLTDGTSPVVEQVTRNVLDRLGQQPTASRG